MPKGQLVFEYGTYGTEYYIILSGKTSVWYKPKEIEGQFGAFSFSSRQNTQVEQNVQSRIKSDFNGVPKMALVQASKVCHSPHNEFQVEYSK